MGRYDSDRDFTRRLIKPDTWAIQGIYESPWTHLLLGKRTAMVVDPGQNRRDIREYIDSITDLPLIVVNTHGHFDHTAANGLFRDRPIYMHPEAIPTCRKCFPHLNPEDYRYDYEPIAIEEGHVFDLGHRTVETIAFGCHSSSSYAYLDRKHRLLFTGDELESGQVLINDPRNLGYASVERYLGNLKKIEARMDEFDTVCPAHNGTPMDAGIIHAFIENCERIMGGIEGKEDISSPTYLHGRPDDPRAADAARLRRTLTFRRSEWKGSSIVYDLNKVFLNGPKT
jgi:glyoxylase-like metal-dependent hydrolase (beta-lactamase superfamily II)